MCRIVFIGPSISPSVLSTYADKINTTFLGDIRDLDNFLIQDNDLFFAPPIKGGDAFFISKYDKIKYVGIIDGYFENTISAWHKELLYLISQNKILLGAASLGALRASELYPLGMIGIGKIFEDYKNHNLTDDDEVTISHGPGHMGYINISEAMVNIRSTIEKAYICNVISLEYKNVFIQLAKSIFYKDRNYGYIIHMCVSEFGLDRKILDNFVEWLKDNRVDQKSIDAKLLIDMIISREISSIENSSDLFIEDTFVWRKFLAQ